MIEDLVPMVDKPVDAAWQKAIEREIFSFKKGSFLRWMHTYYIEKLWKLIFMLLATDVAKMQDPRKGPEENSQIFSGVMAFVMGIAAMIRVTRTLPKKLTDATIYSNPEYCIEDTKPKSAAPDAYGADYMVMVKRIAALEDTVKILTAKPAAMLAEKEELLQAAVSRVDMLERELLATKKVHTVTILKRAILYMLAHFKMDS